MYKLCPRCQQDKWSIYKDNETIYNFFCSECHEFSYSIKYEDDASKVLLKYSISTNLFKIDLDFEHKTTIISKCLYSVIIFKFPILLKINEHMSNEDINSKIKKYIVFT